MGSEYQRSAKGFISSLLLLLALGRWSGKLIFIVAEACSPRQREGNVYRSQSTGGYSALLTKYGGS